MPYLNHNIGDAIRPEMLKEDNIPVSVRRASGTRHSQRIDVMVTDVVEASWACTGVGGTEARRPAIAISTPVRRTLNTLREFMFEQVYLPVSNGSQSQTAKEILTFLHAYCTDFPKAVPEEYRSRHNRRTRGA